MKRKFVFCILAVFLMYGSVFAQNCNEEFLCKDAYELTPSYSRFLSKVTGNKFLSEQIAQIIIKNNLKKIADGNFDIKTEFFSARDMKAGRFKSLEIKGKNININGMYLTALNLKTICDFNYLYIDKDWNMTVIEDLPMTFDFTITQDDLDKTVLSESYIKMLNDINRHMGVFFTVQSNSFKIKNEKLYCTMKIVLPFVRKPQEIVFYSGLKVQDGQIKFTDARILNKSFSLNAKKLLNILNYINPLDFSVIIQENKNVKINVKNIYIQNNEIKSDGTIVLLKDLIDE